MANEQNLEMVCDKYFGISARRYRQLTYEKGAPPVVRGKIDLKKGNILAL